MLGEQFYDFFYEDERIVVGAPGTSQSAIPVDSSSSPSVPKKARVDFQSEATTEQGGTSASVVGNSSSRNYTVSSRLSTVSETEEEEDSDDGGHTELLIHSMAKEHAAMNSPDQCNIAVDMSSEGDCGGMDNVSLCASPIPDDRLKSGAWAITPIPPSPAFLCYSKNYGVGNLPHL